MNVSQAFVFSLFFVLCAHSTSLAQRKTGSDGAFPSEILIGEQTFMDVGPPFGDYQIYILTGHANSTDVERLTLVPPGDACFQPATIDTATTSVSKNLSSLLSGKDPCSIPDKALHHEGKRCKHCVVFSGMHVTMQLQCRGALRNIPYEVLDRDLFAQNPDTPQHTSQLLELISSLNEALGGTGGIMDRPLFSTGAPVVPSKTKLSIHLIELRDGRFDELFPNADQKLSRLYAQTLEEHPGPNVELLSSVPNSPIDPVLPVYPPIARAAHVEGTVELTAELNADGSVSHASISSGPPMLRAAVLDAVNRWKFPTNSSSALVELRYNLNCVTPTKK